MNSYNHLKNIFLITILSLISINVALSAEKQITGYFDAEPPIRTDPLLKLFSRIFSYSKELEDYISNNSALSDEERIQKLWKLRRHVLNFKEFYNSLKNEEIVKLAKQNPESEKIIKHISSFIYNKSFNDTLESQLGDIRNASIEDMRGYFLLLKKIVPPEEDISSYKSSLVKTAGKGAAP